MSYFLRVFVTFTAGGENFDDFEVHSSIFKGFYQLKSQKKSPAALILRTCKNGRAQTVIHKITRLTTQTLVNHLSARRHRNYFDSRTTPFFFATCDISKVLASFILAQWLNTSDLSLD